MARFGKDQVGSASNQVSEIDLATPGARYGGFLRRGQSWFCTTGLPSNIIIEVDEMLFHLHKFPLISRSGRISKLVAEATSSDDDDDDDFDGLDHAQQIRLHACRIQMHGMPGGPETFELVAKFCYGLKVELTASNVAALRCAAEYLHMTEEYGENNLIASTERFLNNIIVRSWKDSMRALKSCETLLPLAEELSLVRKCVDSIALKVCTEPSLYGWPMMDHKASLQSPSGKLIWNGNRTKTMSKNVRVDWWYEDVSILNLPLFKCVIHSMEEKGLKPEALAGALMYYARKSIPGMHRRQLGSNGSILHSASSCLVSSCSAEQLFCLETIESLLPVEEGTVTTVFLSGLLKVAMILNANESCRENLEKRLGAQLEQASVDNILIPNYSDSSETLYDVECVLRIVQHFFNTTKALVVRGDANQIHLPRASSSATPLVAVAKLMDDYLAEIASDVNLKPAKFQAILEVLPRDARVLDDGMYRAIDIFLKAHPWVEEAETDALCNMMNCEKLTPRACEHAAQNKTLPLRVVAQVLFLEQAQLRAAFAGAFEAAAARTPTAASLPSVSNATPATRLTTGQMLAWHVGSEGSQASLRPELSQMELRADLTGLRHRIAELERECAYLRRHLEHKATGWTSLSSKLGCRSMSHLTNDTSSHAQHNSLSSASSPPRIAAPYQ